MTQANHFSGFCNILVLAVLNQIPETAEETGNALNASFIPLCIQLRRSYKQLIHSQCITAVIANQSVWRNNIALGFTHLNAVLAGNHTLVKQLFKGLVKINHANIMQELGIEPGIQQMEHCMLYAANIHINRQILVCFLSGYQLLIVVAVYIPQEIPGGTCPLRHGVGLTLCRTAALRTGAVYPLIDSCQRRFSGTGRLVTLYLRKT